MELRGAGYAPVVGAEEKCVGNYGGEFYGR